MEDISKKEKRKYIWINFLWSFIISRIIIELVLLWYANIFDIVMRIVITGTFDPVLPSFFYNDIFILFFCLLCIFMPILIYKLIIKIFKLDLKKATKLLFNSLLIYMIIPVILFILYIFSTNFPKNSLLSSLVNRGFFMFIFASCFSLILVIITRIYIAIELKLKSKKHIR